MSTGVITKWLRSRKVKKTFRIGIIASVFAIVFLQIVLFSPMDLESEKAISRIQAVDPKSILQDIRGTLAPLAPKVPVNRMPEYRVKQFRYISSNLGKKDWKLFAEEADSYLLGTAKLIHGKGVTAQLFDSKGQITLVTGNETQYSSDGRDLEVFGNVVSRFPDGMIVKSEYMQYMAEKKIMFIPLEHKVEGLSLNQQQTKEILFKSLGMTYTMDESRIFLPKNVFFKMKKTAKNSVQNPEDQTPDESTIESDICTVERKANTAFFEMDHNRPLAERFVLTRQPGIFIKSRTLDLNYGDYANVIHYMTAKEDVFIEEKNDDGLKRQATGGQADFDAKKNIIILTRYPQVYQDNDTVTGNLIKVYRDTDIVEVEHSNAFSEGEKLESKP